MNRPYWNHYFKVQISKPRIWIRWSYCAEGETPRPNKIMPKLQVFCPDGHRFEYEYKLPDPFESEGRTRTPTVADEIMSWGWRTWSEESLQCNGEFRLAESKEACLEAAMDNFRYQGLIPEGIVVISEDGDSTSEPLPPEWKEFADEALAAVKLWSSGNDWPSGWRGKT
jgi:hypothetical protein